MTIRIVLGATALFSGLSLLSGVGVAASSREASEGPAPVMAPDTTNAVRLASPSSPAAPPGRASSPAPERFPSPAAVTVVFVALWALLLVVVVASAGRAQRIQRDLDDLENRLRGATLHSPGAPS